MANLTPIPSLTPVPQLEATTKAQGGPGEIMNAQAQALLNRIALLEENITSGTVTSISVINANGISGVVTTPNTTPALTLSLGAITPSSVSTSTLTLSGDIQQNNATYLKGKLVAGTSTRLFGLNNTNILYIGSIDASHAHTMFVNGGIEQLRITSTGGISFGPSGDAIGTPGQVLTSVGNAPPTWSTIEHPNQSVTLTGDVTASGSGSLTTTLASVGTPGTYRSVTTDSKGRVSGGTNPTTLAGYSLTGVQSAAVRTIQTSFDWAGILPTIALAPGVAQWSEGVGAYARRVHSALIGLGTTWVDPINGNDSNDGSKYSPVKTLEHAVRNTNPSDIACLPGKYQPFQFRSTDVPGNKLKIVRALGECVICSLSDDPTTATWTVDPTFPNVYYMDLTPTNRPPCAVLDTSREDRFSMPVPLTKFNSIALTSASIAGGWFHDEGTNRLYVRYGIGDVNSVKMRLKLVTGDANSRILVYGAKLLMEGRWHLEGVDIVPLDLAASRSYLYMDVNSALRPTIAYHPFHGIDSLGSDTYIQGAWLHRNQGDNFHYADSGALGCRAIEINCKATYAGDINTISTAPNTSNGSSIHGTANILRINGYYGYNYGPDIVDTGTGYSWNVGTVTESFASNGNSYGFYTICGGMHLDTCVARNGINADIKAENSPLFLHSTSYRTSSIVGTGSISTYYP